MFIAPVGTSRALHLSYRAKAVTPFRPTHPWALGNVSLGNVRLGSAKGTPQLDEARFHAPPLIGDSPLMRQVKEDIADVSPLNTTVMVLGETGVGKEVVARQIHAQSPRQGQPFIAKNCAALPEALAESELFGHMHGAFTGTTGYQPGVFEQAGEGTLFLDEIQSLPLTLQPKLLRAINERRITPVGAGGREFETKCRLVVAANADLGTMVEKGDFREDLYYRLIPFAIKLPPLRARLEDIPLFVPRLFQVLREQGEIPDRDFSLTPDAIEFIQSLPLAGNVRELKGLIGIAAIKAKPAGRTELTGEDLLAAARRYNGYGKTLDKAEADGDYVEPDYRNYDAIQGPTVAEIAEAAPWKQSVTYFKHLYFAQLWHTVENRAAINAHAGSGDISHQLRQINLNQFQDRTAQQIPIYDTVLTQDANPKDFDLTTLPVTALAQLPFKEATAFYTGAFVLYNGQNETSPTSFRRKFGTPTGMDRIMAQYKIRLGETPLTTTP